MKLSPAIATSTANDHVAAKKPFSVKTNVRAGMRGWARGAPIFGGAGANGAGGG